MRLNPSGHSAAAGARPRVASVPYDVSRATIAAKLAEGNPHQLTHVGPLGHRLPPTTDPYDPRVTPPARPRSTVCDRRDADPRGAPAYTPYRQVMDWRAQTGIVGCSAYRDYERGHQRRSTKKTRPDKEDDLDRQVLTLEANAEPCSERIAAPRPRAWSTAWSRRSPSTTSPAGWGTPRVWHIGDTRPFCEAMGTVPVAYVADGHHRSASAWRAGKERRAANPNHHGNEEYNWFLAVLFPAEDLRILPYNRIVRDLGGRKPAEVLDALGRIGRLEATEAPEPDRPGSVGIYMDAVASADVRSRLDSTGTTSSRSLDVSLRRTACSVRSSPSAIREPTNGSISGRDPRAAALARRVDSGKAAIAFACTRRRFEHSWPSPKPAGDAAEEHLVRAEAAQRADGAHARMTTPFNAWISCGF